jgi:hypothetical protein
VEIHVHDNDLLDLPWTRGGLKAADALHELFDLFILRQFHNPLDRKKLQRLTQAVDFLDIRHGRLDNESPAVYVNHHKAFRRQKTEGFPNRTPTDAQLLGQLGLNQPLAQFEFAFQNRRPNGSDDVFCKKAFPEGL